LFWWGNLKGRDHLENLDINGVNTEVDLKGIELQSVGCIDLN
jgi:hypothetical protein